MRLVAKSRLFQSLSGFLMSCNDTPSSCRGIGRSEFQSLSGFLMSCNKQYFHSPTGAVGKLFQSLSGFLMSCNEAPGSSPSSGGGTLFQSLSGFLMSCNLSRMAIKAPSLSRFQSLSGFLMSCNRAAELTAIELWAVSIPIGFSNEL